MAMNGEGASRKIHVDYDEDWLAFDALPKSMRQAIAAAPFQYDVQGIPDDFKVRTSALFGFSVYEYVNIMESNFRADVKRDSTTGAEINGTYKLVRRVHGKPARTNVRRQSARPNHQRYRVF